MTRIGRHEDGLRKFQRCIGTNIVKEVIARPPNMESFAFFVHEKDDIRISRRITRTGVWEPFESIMMLGLLEVSDQFIDIGANIGWYTIAAARRVGQMGHVIAIEPDAVNFALLEANIARDRSVSVTAVRCALGSAPGRATINSSSDNKGDHRVRHFTPLGHGTGEGAVSIAVESLDDLIERIPQFDLARLRIIKIDVQGFEADVLSGARRLLSRLPERTLLFVEFDPLLLRDNHPASCEEMITLMGSINREIFKICRPLWRLRRLGAGDLERLALTGGMSDLIVAHESQIHCLREVLPLIPRILSGRELAPSVAPR